tara:strand:+ start:800 stop:1168 length:369 start_codon:yes stop_codon:yes gene_type:complete
MEYTLYKSNGHWLADIDCTGDVPILEDGQQVVEGYYGSGTMLEDVGVSPASGDALSVHNEELLSAIRGKRNVLLASSDWIDLPSCPLSTEKKMSWQTYRTVLRDLPSNTTNLENPTWPTPPT